MPEYKRREQAAVATASAPGGLQAAAAAEEGSPIELITGNYMPPGYTTTPFFKELQGVWTEVLQRLQTAAEVSVATYMHMLVSI